MDTVDPRAFEYALGKINDGFIFERFAQEFISSVIGCEFIPAGGIHDRGIDGLEHIIVQDKPIKNIYQMSIEKEPERKIEKSIKKLFENGIDFDLFVYVTNVRIPDQDQLIDDFYKKYNRRIRIYDGLWLANRVNHSPATIGLYHAFVSNYLHEFQQPGKSFEIGDLVSDPRLFVFLRPIPSPTMK